MTDEARAVWRRFGRAGLFAAVTVGLGVIAGCLLVHCMAPRVVQRAQIPGGFLLLWSILAEMHEEIATWDGDTPQERLNRRLFLVLSGTGTFLLAVGTSAALISP